MSDATTDTNDHADEAVAMLDAMPSSALKNPLVVMGHAKTHALLAIAQEIAAARRAFEDAFGGPVIENDIRKTAGGAVFEVLDEIRDIFEERMPR